MVAGMACGTACRADTRRKRGTIQGVKGNGGLMCVGLASASSSKPGLERSRRRGAWIGLDALGRAVLAEQAKNRVEKISLGPTLCNWRSSERTLPRTMAKPVAHRTMNGSWTCCRHGAGHYCYSGGTAVGMIVIFVTPPALPRCVPASPPDELTRHGCPGGWIGRHSLAKQVRS